MVGKLTVVIEKSQLRTLCLHGDALRLTIDSAIFKHAMNIGTLVLRNLHKLHPLIDQSNLCGIGCPDFAIHKRKKIMTN